MCVCQVNRSRSKEDIQLFKYEPMTHFETKEMVKNQKGHLLILIHDFLKLISYSEPL